MATSLQTKRARTSLIDAEWDWIANRLTQRAGGHWAVASVVNPSLARICYAPSRTMPPPGPPPAPALPAAPPPSRPRKSAHLSPRTLAAPTTSRLSFLAVLLTALVGLAAGALLHRVTSNPGVSSFEASASPVPVEPAQIAAGVVAMSPASTIAAATPPVVSTAVSPAGSAPGTKPTAPRRRARPLAPRRVARESPAQSDNPY